MTRQLLSIGLLAALLALPAPLLAEHLPDDPAGVVLRFVVHDRNGARLSSAGWQRVDGLIDDPEAHGWQTGCDTAFVIDGYRLGNVVHEGDSARVTVIYQNLGRVEGDRWQPADAAGRIREEAVEYLLQRRDGRWRIVQPAPPPHPSASALCALSPRSPICPR